MGCAVATPEQDCGDASVSNARPYCELSPEAQARAREVWREKGWTWDEWDSKQLTDLFKDELAETYGIEDADVEWDLSCCQGDHVSFKARPDIDKLVEHDDRLAKLWQAVQALHAAALGELDASCYVKIENGSVLVECGIDIGPNYDCRVLHQLELLIEKEVLETYHDACSELKRMGYAEIEYHNSDEVIADTLEANEYRFDEDGAWENA